MPGVSRNLPVACLPFLFCFTVLPYRTGRAAGSPARVRLLLPGKCGWPLGDAARLAARWPQIPARREAAQARGHTPLLERSSSPDRLSRRALPRLAVALPDGRDCGPNSTSLPDHGALSLEGAPAPGGLRFAFAPTSPVGQSAGPGANRRPA